MSQRFGKVIVLLAAVSMGALLAIGTSAAGASASSMAGPTRSSLAGGDTLALAGNDLIAAIGVVLSKGYDVTGVAITSGPSAVDFLAISGVAINSADGYNQWVFFFSGSAYIGTDTAVPSTSLALAGSGVDNAGNGFVRVSYANYGPNDPLCCPSLAPVVITYRWDGVNLTPNGTPPGH